MKTQLVVIGSYKLRNNEAI